MEHNEENTVNKTAEQKYGFQIVQPSNGTGYDRYGEPIDQHQDIENIVLSEAAQLKKILKKPDIDVSLWLYASHLRIDDTTNKQPYANIPILSLKRMRAIWYRPGVIIKVKGSRYRLVWGQTEKVNPFVVMLRFLVFVFKGDERSKLWVSTAKKLKKQAAYQKKHKEPKVRIDINLPDPPQDVPPAQ